MSAKTVMKSPAELRPHALNKELYGPPTANSAYKDIKASMARGGFDDRHPLLVTADDRVLCGVTRWHVARALGLAAVPCLVFQPKDTDAAEVEAEAEIVCDNTYRVKDEVILAREQRKLLELEKELARRRMGAGSDGGPSKSADRVGKVFRQSGKTVQRRQKVLEAIEAAEAGGDRKTAERLTQLLNNKQTVKALAVIDGAKKPDPRPAKVEVPPTLLDDVNLAHSKFFEACAKVRLPAEADMLGGYLERMADALKLARQKLGATVAPKGDE
jgi:hypothetical protein